MALTFLSWRSDKRAVSDFQQGLVFHALHKSASTFMHQFFDRLCGELQIPLYSIHNPSFNRRQAPPDINHRFVFGPIRSFQIDDYIYPNLDCVNHLIQVRDPRDILVSEYYSLGWLHTEEHWQADDRQRRERIQQLSIDEYVLQQEQFSKHSLLDRYSPILGLLERDDVVIVRYEEMVSDFARWLHPIVELMKLRPPNAWRRRLGKRYRNEFVAGPAPGSHKRNVTPGDHRDKLRPATIEKLNQQYEKILRALNYPFDR